MRKSKKTDLSQEQLRFEWRDPNSIRKNAKNWRTHSRRQRQAFQAFFRQIGWAGTVLINETTGNLLDGHMRVDEAIKAGEEKIPCAIGNWTEQQENLILQNLDPIGALAGTDREALASLTSANNKQLTNLQDDNTRRLAQLTRDLESFSQGEDAGPLIKQSKAVRKPKVKEEPEEEPDTTYEAPEDNRDVRREIIESDVFFPSTDPRQVPVPLHLPDLLPHLLASPDDAPRQVFNRSRSQKHTPDTYYCISSVPWPKDREGGVLGFFTEDYRFNQCYDFASNFLEELLEEDWNALCLPDYSLYDDYPLPMKLWNLYRSRWCGRYWQESGFPVIPIIQACQVTPTLDLTRELCIDSLPGEVPLAACQVRSNAGYKEFCEDLNYAVETKNIQTLMIYGGEDRQKVLHGYLTDKCEILYLPSFIKSRREVLKREKD